MEIKDLHARMGNVELTAEVIDKARVREFDKAGNKGRVCNARIKDDTGSIVLTLWNDDIDKIDVGDKIKITNGYVGEWQGELQLGAGKFGKIEIVTKGSKEQKVYSNVQEDVGSSEESDDYDEPDDVEEEYF